MTGRIYRCEWTDFRNDYSFTLKRILLHFSAKSLTLFISRCMTFSSLQLRNRLHPIQAHLINRLTCVLKWYGQRFHCQRRQHNAANISRLIKSTLTYDHPFWTILTECLLRNNSLKRLLSRWLWIISHLNEKHKSIRGWKWIGIWIVFCCLHELRSNLDFIRLFTRT